MMATRILIKRNIKLFFKDKGLFLVSLITPVILLVLYIVFLGDIYRDSFLMHIPQGFSVDEKIVDGLVACQLMSSILGVSCITVAFCSNMLMVQDRANGSIKDFTISPIKPSTLAISYYVSNIVTTLMVCLSALAVCLVYVAFVGWYMTVLDVIMLTLDVILLVLFGSALSSVVNFFLSSQGQIAAVGTIVSTCYGYISGAYMPLSQFSVGLQRIIMFMPGTYGTALLKNHAMRGAFYEMESNGLPTEIINASKDAMDINIYFFENKVEIWNMYLILAVTIIVLMAIYVLLSVLKSQKIKK